eukprot:4180014-Pleurochrysis_carterae.AAC.2
MWAEGETGRSHSTRTRLEKSERGERLGCGRGKDWESGGLEEIVEEKQRRQEPGRRQGRARGGSARERTRIREERGSGCERRQGSRQEANGVRAGDEKVAESPLQHVAEPAKA